MGLLVLRLVGGGAIVARAAAPLRSGPSTALAGAALVATGAGLLLLAGLWTPLAGSLVAAIGISYAVTQTGDPIAGILLATIGAALALIGPGAWSIDARVFGWKRIDVHARTK